MFTTLITAHQLHQLNQVNQTHKQIVIVDCRHDLMDATAAARVYADGHISGALLANLDTQLSGSKTSADGVFKGRHPLPASEDLIQNLRALGINQNSQVIAYDAHGGMFAARLWWLLRSVGHQAVAVLDGGLPAWLAQGFDVSTEHVITEMGDIQMQTSLTKQVNVQDILNNITQPVFTVVDARSPDRYRGENETIDPVGGHIPNAKNRFFKDNLQADGCFKSPEQLRQEWQSIIEQAQTAVMQCGSGVTACHNLLALEIAGLSGAALYPGSWSEWCADASRPVALG